MNSFNNQNPSSLFHVMCAQMSMHEVKLKINNQDFIDSWSFPTYHTCFVFTRLFTIPRFNNDHAPIHNFDITRICRPLNTHRRIRSHTTLLGLYVLRNHGTIGPKKCFDAKFSMHTGHIFLRPSFSQRKVSASSACQRTEIGKFYKRSHQVQLEVKILRD